MDSACCTFHSPMYALSPQCVRPGYWIFSLLSYDFQGHACPARPLRSNFRHTPPQLSDSIVGNLAHSLRCNKAKHVYLRARHLLTYADLVAWSGNSWRWQLPDLPADLSAACRSLALPVAESVALLPGQAWHLTSPAQLFSNRITEVLTVNTYSTPRGLRSDIVYRHWTLPRPVLSPPLQTVITHVTPPQLYHGPIDFLDSWFPILFGLKRPHRVSRVSLITLNGAPHRTGLPPPLSDMDTLPESVEVYRASPFLPPGHLGRVIRSGPPLTLSCCSPDPNHVGKRTVYDHLHCHSGYSSLHSVLGSGTYRISLSVSYAPTTISLGHRPFIRARSPPRALVPPTGSCYSPASYGVYGSPTRRRISVTWTFASQIRLLSPPSALLRSLSPMKWQNFCMRLPIFTSVPRAESAMPPLLETSPRSPSPVAP